MVSLKLRFPKFPHHFLPPVCADDAACFPAPAFATKPLAAAPPAIACGATGFCAPLLAVTVGATALGATPAAAACGPTGFVATAPGVATPPVAGARRGRSRRTPPPPVSPPSGRKTITVWHCGQRTFNIVLPRKTANGTRIAAWHLLQITRIESVGAAASAGFAPAPGWLIANGIAFAVNPAGFGAPPVVCGAPRAHSLPPALPPRWEPSAASRAPP